MDLFTSEDVTAKKITNEVCVHHLWFDESDYEKYGSKIKWNPSLKSIDRAAYGMQLIQAKLICLLLTMLLTLWKKKTIHTLVSFGGLFCTFSSGNA
jgi:dihydroorotase-like cyclic amidohydrolase